MEIKDIINRKIEAKASIIIVKKITPPKYKPFYQLVKRSFDFFISIFATILLIFPMFIIAFLIKIDSKGPILYKQERLGKDGKPFMLFKFRSMVLEAEIDGEKWAKENDERCTRVGAVLRRFRLDELPQIPFNILPGTLSLVGPRPERKFFYDKFSKYIDGFEQRLMVKPGLTGWAQVNGGYDLEPEEKIIYDLEYIEQQSILKDLECIFKTFNIIFNHKGAR